MTGKPIDAADCVPQGVQEALQRLIENAATLGPASREDALLVARHRALALTAAQQQPEAQGGGEVEPDGYTSYGEFRWACDCDERQRREWTPVYLAPPSAPVGVEGGINVPAAKALIEALAPGFKVIYRSAFRWLDQGGNVLPNHYEMFSAETLARNFGYDLVLDLGYAAILRDPSALAQQPEARGVVDEAFLLELREKFQEINLDDNGEDHLDVSAEGLDLIDAKLAALTAAQQQGQAVEPYVYMQDCSLETVTYLKSKGQPAMFSCMTVKDELHTFPLYTAPPPSAPVGVDKETERRLIDVAASMLNDNNGKIGKKHFRADATAVVRRVLKALAQQPAADEEAAEIEALRAEVDRLRAGIIRRDDDVVVPGKLYDEINAIGAKYRDRAEWLEEALRRLNSATRRYMEERPGSDAEWASDEPSVLSIVDAALEQETTNG